MTALAVNPLAADLDRAERRVQLLERQLIRARAEAEFYRHENARLKAAGAVNLSAELDDLVERSKAQLATLRELNRRLDSARRAV